MRNGLGEEMHSFDTGDILVEHKYYVRLSIIQFLELESKQYA